MPLELSLTARNFRLAQSEAERVLLDEVIETIRQHPTQGTLLPYPWQPGTREIDLNGYTVSYVYHAEDRRLFIRAIKLSPLYG